MEWIKSYDYECRLTLLYYTAEQW